MQAVTLRLAWAGKRPQSFIFDSVESAISSAEIIFARFHIEPLKAEWRELLLVGQPVATPTMTATLFVETVSENPLTEEDIEEPEFAKSNPIIKYVLMRTDVPQYLTGRAAAQSNHAGTAFVIRAYRKNDPALTAMIDEWEKEGDGFGTTIVKSVTAAEMRQAVSLATLSGVHADIVHDPEYFIKDGDNVHFIPVDTCAFVFGRKDDCQPIVGRFPLLKEPHE